jgi:hypothetical protein
MIENVLPASIFAHLEEYEQSAREFIYIRHKLQRAIRYIFLSLGLAEYVFQQEVSRLGITVTGLKVIELDVFAEYNHQYLINLKEVPIEILSDILLQMIEVIKARRVIHL